jgi:hypothetical protein
MPVLDEVAALKRKLEELKIKRARLQERLDAERNEKERLLQEAREMGVDDPTKLSEFVDAKKQEFDAERAKIAKLIEEASK